MGGAVRRRLQRASPHGPPALGGAGGAARGRVRRPAGARRARGRQGARSHLRAPGRDRLPPLRPRVPPSLPGRSAPRLGRRFRRRLGRPADRRIPAAAPGCRAGRLLRARGALGDRLRERECPQLGARPALAGGRRVRGRGSRRGVIGLVLAAGAGTRLSPWTDTLPKTLVPVDADRSILDVALANLRRAGLDEVVVVVGFAADRVRERVAELEQRHGVRLELVFNPKAEEWNNAYSLWCARDAFADGALLVNGDTVHPASVEERLLADRGEQLTIAVDDVKPLGQEEMKVHVSSAGLLERINKRIDPASADGE